MVGGEGLEGVEGVLGGDALLVDPADLALFGADLDEAAAVFEDGKLVAVGDAAGAVGDGGDAVAKKTLFGGDVDVLGEDLGADVAAAEGEEEEKGEGPRGAVRLRVGRFGRVGLNLLSPGGGGVPPPPYLGWKCNGMMDLRPTTGCKIF